MSRLGLGFQTWLAFVGDEIKNVTLIESKEYKQQPKQGRLPKERARQRHYQDPWYALKDHDDQKRCDRLQLPR